MSNDGIEKTLKKPRRRSNRTGAIVAATIAIAAIGGGVYIARVRSAAAAAATATQYKVGTASSGQVKHTVSASGTLQPWREVDIKSRAGGEVKVLAVEVGDIVKQGQIIARIDPSDSLTSYQQAVADYDSAVAKKDQSSESYQLQTQQTTISIQNAQASLASAQASRAQAAARLATAQTASDSQPGLTSAAIAQAQASYDQAVKQRRQLDATNPQDRASAKATYDQAVANRVNAKATLERQQALLTKGFVSQSTVDQAQASLSVYDAQVATAKTKLDTLAAEQQANVENADARVDQAKAALDAAKRNSIAIASQRNSLSEAKAALQQAEAQVKVSAAALAQAQANAKNNAIKRYDVVSATATIAHAAASKTNAQIILNQTEVRSPSAGVILQKYVEQGTIITSGLSLNSTGTSIVQIGEIGRMYVDVTVDETDIASVDEGQTVDVSFDAYPGVPFVGKVARINPAAVVESNVTSVHVRVEVDNSSPTFRLLKPGMNATCEFVLDQKDNVVNVPNEAIHEDDKGKYVEVVTSPGKPSKDDPTSFVGVKTKRVTVETGLEGNDTTEITSGLKGTETIVTQSIEPTPTTAAGGALGGSPFGGNRGGGGGGRR